MILFSSSSNAQFIEDALRFSQPTAAFSPRVSALGFSYFGISDDAAAMIFNPAGLSLIRGYEINTGVDFTTVSNKTNYLNETKKTSDYEFYISNIQMTFPMSIPVSETEAINYTIGIGYYLDNDFDMGYRFSGFNTKNTFISQQAAEHSKWIYETWLTDEAYNTNIRNNMQQEGRISEEGGLHNFVCGAGIDVTDNLSLGASFIIKGGHYDYYRSFMESDSRNLYNTFEIDDIDNVIVSDILSQEIAGFTGSLGLMARINDNLRIGASIKFPTYNYIEEDYSSEYTVTYDSNEVAGVQKFNYSEHGSNNYSITTPFEFSLGTSGYFAGLTFSVAASYKNASHLKFDYDLEDQSIATANYFDNLNEDVDNNLTGVWTFGAGLEYKIPDFPIYVRASYTRITSPYDIDLTDASRQMIAGGLGIVCAKNFIIDASFRLNSFKQQQAVYGNLNEPSLYSYYIVNYSPVDYGLGIRYRF